MGIVVASLNLQHCERSSAEQIAALLAGRGVGLAALQEVDLGMVRSGRVDQPAVLAAESGLGHYAFAPTLRRGRGLYGLLILSASPLSDYYEIPLPRLGAEEPRLAQVAAVEVAGGLRVSIVNTHLAARSASAHAQLRHLSDALAQSSAPLLLAGDFNGVAVPEGFAEFDLAATFPSEAPRKRIDHIAVRPDFSASIRWETVCAPELTDHCLVLAHVG